LKKKVGSAAHVKIVDSCVRPRNLSGLDLLLGKAESLIAIGLDSKASCNLVSPRRTFFQLAFMNTAKVEDDLEVTTPVASEAGELVQDAEVKVLSGGAVRRLSKDVRDKV
jgi:hypothetical protein